MLSKRYQTEIIVWFTYMKFKNRIISLGIENRVVVARVVKVFVELNEGNSHYSWRGEG